MGRLIDSEKRERAKRERVERKRRILEVARSTFCRLPFVEVTLDNIGQGADVDRGVTSMYFGTKEELFLRLLKEELEGWYSEIEEEFNPSDGAVEQLEVAALLTSSLGRRPTLTRLLSFETMVLEQNIDAMQAFHFQRWRRDRMGSVGELIERTTEGLEPGQGVRLLHRAQLLTSALAPVADPRGAAAYEAGDPDFAVFKVDFEAELTALLMAYLSHADDAAPRGSQR